MATVESLDCPNCGAPLPRQSTQTLAACLYCNSTIRITPGAAPVATRAVEVPPEVIDEVKRMLLISQHAAAVTYYAKEAQVEAAVAEQAVQGIERNMAYYPPLSLFGVALIGGLALVGVAAVVGGAMVARTYTLAGSVLMVLGVAFAGANLWLIWRGLPGLMLSLRGRPAAAQVLKTWLIRAATVRGEPVELTRMLLEVRPDGGRPYQAEANIYVRVSRKPRFAPGSLIRVKYDPPAPDRVVVIGPAAEAS